MKNLSVLVFLGSLAGSSLNFSRMRLEETAEIQASQDLKFRKTKEKQINMDKYNILPLKM